LEQPGQMLQPPMFAARVFVGPAEIIDKGMFYVWADKIGTVFTSHAKARGQLLAVLDPFACS